MVGELLHQLHHVLGHVRARMIMARDGDVLSISRVFVAPPGRHLLVTSEARIGLIDTGPLPRHDLPLTCCSPLSR